MQFLNIIRARFRTGKAYWSQRKKHWMNKISKENAQIAKLTQYIKINKRKNLQKEGAYTLTSDVALLSSLRFRSSKF